MSHAQWDTHVGLPLNLEHCAQVEKALFAMSQGQGEMALSDPVFSNLYLFRHAHVYRFVQGPLPCIAGRTYDGTPHLLPLFKLQQAPIDALRHLLRGFECFYPLAQSQVDELDPNCFTWTSLRDDVDYLYPASNFRHYRGTTLNKKRNLVKQLLRTHTVTSELYAVELFDEARKVLACWMVEKALSAGEADDNACIEALQLAPRLGLRGFVHRVGGEPAGFVLAQSIQPGVWVMRFAKGLDRFKGIYQYMFQHFCEAMPEVRWLNFEQDMGLINFRRSKLSYQPSALLSKFRVQLRKD